MGQLLTGLTAKLGVKRRDDPAGYGRLYAEKNREKMNAYAREYYHEVKKLGARHKAYSQEYGRWYRRLKKYGVAKKQYLAMVDQQNGQCAICGIGAGLDLRIDHDHETGRVRGLLCEPCNLGLGFLRDSIATLNAAVRYLHEHSVENPEKLYRNQ